MVRRLLVDGEGISIVIGQAGTGKTYATLTAAEGRCPPECYRRDRVRTRRVGIDFDLRRLTRTHIGELRLLEVRRHPDLRRHDRRKGLADLHALLPASTDLFVTRPATARRDLRIGLLQLRLMQFGLRLGRTLGLCELRARGAGLFLAFLA